MRRATGGSNFLSCLTALSASSIFQAKLTLYFFKADHAFLAGRHTRDNLAREKGVFQVLDLIDDRLPDLKRLGAAGDPRQPLEAGVKRLFQPDR